MKGPGYRYDVDVRRSWQCPACGNRVRSQGEATTRRCRCTEAGTWMKLVDENVRRTFPERQPIVIPEPDAELDETSTVPEDSASDDRPAEAPALPEAPLATTETETVPLEQEPAAESADSVTEQKPQADRKAESSETSSSRRRRDKKRRRKKSKRRGSDAATEPGPVEATPDSTPSTQPPAEPPPTPGDAPEPPESSDSGGFGENVFD